MGRFFVVSLEYETFFPFDMDFHEICMGSLVEMVTALFIESFGGLELFFNLPLSFLNSYVEDNLPQRFAIVFSIS